MFVESSRRQLQMFRLRFAALNMTGTFVIVGRCRLLGSVHDCGWKACEGQLQMFRLRFAPLNMTKNAFAIEVRAFPGARSGTWDTQFWCLGLECRELCQMRELNSSLTRPVTASMYRTGW
jgi:hypothetical protein